jgi:hypothetical protein
MEAQSMNTIILLSYYVYMMPRISKEMSDDRRSEIMVTYRDETRGGKFFFGINRISTRMVNSICRRHFLPPPYYMQDVRVERFC